MTCRKCGGPVSADAAAMTKKMVNRAETSFFCLTCLAEEFKCPVSLLLEKIEHFRAQGCTLFEPKATEKGENRNDTSL